MKSPPRPRRRITQPRPHLFDNPSTFFSGKEQNKNSVLVSPNDAFIAFIVVGYWSECILLLPPSFLLPMFLSKKVPMFILSFGDQLYQFCYLSYVFFSAWNEVSMKCVCFWELELFILPPLSLLFDFRLPSFLTSPFSYFLKGLQLSASHSFFCKSPNYLPSVLWK